MSCHLILKGHSKTSAKGSILLTSDLFLTDPTNARHPGSVGLTGGLICGDDIAMEEPLVTGLFPDDDELAFVGQDTAIGT